MSEHFDSSTSVVLSNYSFLSPLKRQRAVRNRSNIVTPSPSKCANRLPVLPELSGEQDAFSSLPPSPVSSTSFLRTSPSVCPSEKRRSRYGRDEFALDQDFLRVATLGAQSPTPAKHQSVSLSAFDIVIDITAPTSPISDSPPVESSSSTLTTPPRPTRSRDIRLQSPPRSRSPTPSLTSMSACSSNDIPTTPLTSDDEWPGLGSSPRLRKAPAAQRVQIHPLVITKSTPILLTSDADPADVFEFTIAPFSDPEDEEEQDEDDVSWYARELGQLVSLASPRAPSASSATTARPDSLPPPPSRASTRSGQHSRMSKPLPAIPRTPGPSPQLDPTFPRQRTTSRRPSRQPLPTYPAPQPPRTATTPSIRKSLKITVPRAPPRTPLPLDVADIFDDIDAWSVFAPSAGLRSSSAATSAGAAELSPPRIPHTPMSAYSQYDPLELIVDYATLPSPQPSPSSSMSPSPSLSPALSSFLPDDGSDDEESEYWPNEEKLRSRWSCSTVATLATRAATSPPTSPSPSARLRFHLGSVARRVRARRTGASGSDSAVPKTHARSSSEPNANSGSHGAVVGVRSESGHEDVDAESCLRRKPIPLELFLR
ncbi:hypothetical protein EDB84DRAFT_545588 [Lactarius hengduanensis]|nr:hypothetical protein EDB84DRAFT_545588 [Lactarius hengduanensis]